MRGVPVTDYDRFLYNNNYVSYEEFLDNEYKDKEIMQDILNNENLFILYRFFTEGAYEDDSLSEGFSESNPMFISFVKLLGELCNKNVLKRDERNKNNILIYRTGLDTSIYPVSEGYVSENIFEVAEELFRDKESRECLYNSLLKTYSIIPKFTKDGDFDCLSVIKE